MEYGYFWSNQIHKLEKPLTASCCVVGIINSVCLKIIHVQCLQATKIMTEGGLEDWLITPDEYSLWENFHYHNTTDRFIWNPNVLIQMYTCTY